MLMSNSIVDFGGRHPFLSGRASASAKVSSLLSIMADRRGHLLGLTVLYLLLSVEYYRFVYGYFCLRMGFQFGVEPVSFMAGIVMMVALMAFMSLARRADDCLYAVAMVVSVLCTIPQIILFQVGRASCYGALYALLLVFLLTYPGVRLPQLGFAKVSDNCRRWLMPVLAVLALLPFAFTFGLPSDLSVLSMDERIYEVRQLASQRGNLITSYLQGPLCKVLFPMLVIMGLSNLRRQWWMALVGVVGMVYLFLVNPEKSILFSVMVVLLCYPFDDYRVKAGVFLYALLTLVFVSVLLNLLTGNIMVESIIVRRLFFIPALVSDAYFAFFDKTPVLLSHSVLGAAFEYPYAVEPSRLIGEMMYARNTINCNTGIIADGFMNFGHVGALCFVALTALVIRFLCACSCDSRYFGLLFLLVFTSLNSALLTTMLTHGGWCLLLACMFLIPPRRAAV